MISIEKQKAIELDILKWLMDFCGKNGLKVFMVYGTLLGAARHQGFIPWDDDVDVAMPRDDYEKLIKIFPEHEHYKLLAWNNCKTYNKPYATLNDIRTVKEEYTIRKKYNRDLCVNVDIFPFDDVPEDKEMLRRFQKKLALRSKMLQCLVWKYSKSGSIKNFILKNGGIFIMRTLEFFGIVSLQSFLRRYTKLLMSYNGGASKFCAQYASTPLEPEQKLTRKDIFDKQILLPFEGYKFAAPEEYDVWLRDCFGDYMVLPPESEREAHHIHYSYWKSPEQIHGMYDKDGQQTT